MKFNSRDELHLAATELLGYIEEQEQGKITEAELLNRWKEFRRAADSYLHSLKQKLN